MGILRQIGDGLLNGTEQFVTIFKPVLNNGAAGWGDAAMSSGIPKYQPYIGDQLKFTPIVYSAGNGIRTADTDAILRVEATTTSSAAGLAYFYILDYVGFYPKIDLEDETPQIMDNTDTLPRYTDGRGLVAFVVVDVVTGASKGHITINYTDENDAAKSTSCFIVENAIASAIASCTNAAQTLAGCTPFIINGGIKRIDSVQVNTPVNGFINIVLAKPLANVWLPETQTVSEKSFVTDMGNLPQFEAGAYLNLIYNKNSSANITATVVNMTLIKAGET